MLFLFYFFVPYTEFIVSVVVRDDFPRFPFSTSPGDFLSWHVTSFTRHVRFLFTLKEEKRRRRPEKDRYETLCKHERSKTGCRVLVFSNGKEAIKLPACNSFYFLILTEMREKVIYIFFVNKMKRNVVDRRFFGFSSCLFLLLIFFFLNALRLNYSPDDN